MENWTKVCSYYCNEYVSPDKRWHISKKSNGEDFLTNYDLLLTPFGEGNSYSETLESFITNCEAFAAALAKVKSEAESMLQQLKNKQTDGVTYETL